MSAAENRAAMITANIRATIKAFLIEFAKSVVDKHNEEQMEGQVLVVEKYLSPELFCIEIQYQEYVDADKFTAEFDKFHMFVSRRHLMVNMVHLDNCRTGQQTFMEAEPALILAWLSF